MREAAASEIDSLKAQLQREISEEVMSTGDGDGDGDAEEDEAVTFLTRGIMASVINRWEADQLQLNSLSSRLDALTVRHGKLWDAVKLVVETDRKSRGLAVGRREKSLDPIEGDSSMVKTLLGGLW